MGTPRGSLYTIGFTKKSAVTFFSLLQMYPIERLLDIRLHNRSQLAGFTKLGDLPYFLKSLCGIDYLHLVSLAPTEDLFRRYKTGAIDWEQYERLFKALLVQRKPETLVRLATLENACLLCSEATADKCHRRLVAEYFHALYPHLEIIHL